MNSPDSRPDIARGRISPRSAADGGTEGAEASGRGARASSLDEWRRVVGNVAAYLRPGGTLYMAALAGMKSYTVRDSSGTTFEYPCACLGRADVAAALAELGFPPDETRLETADIEHPDCGVTATLVVAAVKRGSAGA